MEGFYKKIDENNFAFAANFVESSKFSLKRELKHMYEYPIDGWYWFESQDAACAFFGINPEQKEV